MFRSESVSKRLKEKSNQPAKNITKKNRIRNKIVSFRLTQKESDLLDQKVKISGILKQDYIIQSLLNHEVKIKSDYRIEESIAMEIFQLARVIKKFGKLNGEEQEVLLFILKIYEEIKKEKASSD